MKKILVVLVALFIVAAIPAELNAKTVSAKKERKIEKKARKLADSKGWDAQRVKELMLMNRKEKKQRMAELKRFDVNNLEATMAMSTEDIINMKTDYSYFANRITRRNNVLFWGGMAGIMVGTAMACSEESAMSISGASVAVLGLGAFMTGYMSMELGNARSFREKSKILIVEAPVRPFELQVGNAHLMAGTSVIRDLRTKQVAYGPSVAISF